MAPLYGLVLARRLWNEELNSHVDSEGFPATLKDPAVYVKSAWSSLLGGPGGVDFVGIGPGKALDMLSKDINTKYGTISRDTLSLHLKDVLAIQC